MTTPVEPRIGPAPFGHCQWPGGCSIQTKSEHALYCRTHELRIERNTESLERLVGAVRDYVWARNTRRLRNRRRPHRDSREFKNLRTQLAFAEMTLMERDP